MTRTIVRFRSIRQRLLTGFWLLVGLFVAAGLAARNSMLTMSTEIGETLESVQEFCAGKVGEARIAVLYEKPHTVVPCDYVWRRTDRWIDFPWSAQAPVVTRPHAVRDA